MRKKKTEVRPKRRGSRWDSNPRVGMSKGLDLVIEKKEEGKHEPPSGACGGDRGHRAHCGIRYGQWALKHSKGMGSQRGE
jgi:hypothetical protein